jgi:nicotinamide-nucleotide amidase
MATGPDPDAARVVALLCARGETLATAESLTGGLLGAAITSVPGASQAYLGGVVVYATAMKARLAGVAEELLLEHGPVSPQVAAALASGVQAGTGAGWGLATTGVAGPDPQDGHAPGEVWVGLARPSGDPEAHRLDLGGDRAAVREACVATALRLLAAALTLDHG